MVDPETSPGTPDGSGAQVRLPPPLVFLGFLVLGLVLHWVWPLDLPFPEAPRYLGGAVLLVGWAYLLGHAYLLFRRSGQDPKPWKPTPSLIFMGPYRFTRNPMYLSMILFVLGIGLALAEGWLVIGAIAAAVVVHYTAVLPEEAYLAERFGEEYLQFKTSVRRWL